MRKNTLRTPGYFIKRLRDNKFIVVKVFAVFGKGDSRRWTVIVNPTEASVFITCYANKDDYGDILFEINDGGNRIPKNFSIKTDSIETIIEYLIRHGVTNGQDYPGRNRYLSKRLNIYDEREKQTQESSKA